MKDIVLKQKRALDELADEVVELVVNSKKLTDLLKTAQENEIIQKRNLSEIATLKKRITNLENRLDRSIKNFKINAIEAERLITEKYEEMNKENERKILNLQSQIEKLRRIIVKIIKSRK